MNTSEEHYSLCYILCSVYIGVLFKHANSCRVGKNAFPGKHSYLYLINITGYSNNYSHNPHYPMHIDGWCCRQGLYVCV